MTFEELPEFRKEFRKFAKKYKSLSDDLEEFRRVLSAAPLGNGGKHFNTLFRSERVNVIKARFFCRYLKGASFRIVYAYAGQPERVEFIELYYKGDKSNEDRGRVERYLKAMSSGIV